MFLANSQTPLNRQQHKKVVRIVHNLLNMPESISFRKPVCYRALGLDDYKDIVKKPIDLNMIRRLNNDWKYKYVEEVLDDIQLCWNNCRAYNTPGSDIYECAVLMEQNFVHQLLQQYPDFKIPEGVIRGRQPITSLNLVGSTVVERDKDRVPEKAEKQVKQHPQSHQNIYERHYDRPMQFRARQRTERAPRENSVRVESTRLESPQERQDSARPYLEDSNMSNEQQLREVEGDLPPLSEAPIDDQKSASLQPKLKNFSAPRGSEMDQEEPLQQLGDDMEDEEQGVAAQSGAEELVAEEQPHEPIIIKLPESPSLENLITLSERMKSVRDKSVLRGIAKIMLEFEPQNSSVNEHTYRFNATSMRWGTYLRIEEFLDNNRC